ncbi:type IV pili methyl-accepting chemotaxis transducer N-terminal domain-containing protein, partial [Achromobacter ruhlandii]|uniref:type IV pili methyl-accepting chemotaxis transducer N-terminal domain-containing protein n=1 Tax=Achromobacter ruhlandii TaxID=72557 RepID=UPI0032119CA5
MRVGGAGTAEGAGGEISEPGSLGRRANRVGVELMRPEAGREARTEEQVRLMDDTIARLARGNPARPLFIPNDPLIRRHWAGVADYWRALLPPAALPPPPPPPPAQPLPPPPHHAAPPPPLRRPTAPGTPRPPPRPRLLHALLRARPPPPPPSPPP